MVFANYYLNVNWLTHHAVAQSPKREKSLVMLCFPDWATGKKWERGVRDTPRQQPCVWLSECMVFYGTPGPVNSESKSFHSV